MACDPGATAGVPAPPVRLSSVGFPDMCGVLPFGVPFQPSDSSQVVCDSGPASVAGSAQDAALVQRMAEALASVDVEHLM